MKLNQHKSRKSDFIYLFSLAIVLITAIYFYPKVNSSKKLDENATYSIENVKGYIKKRQGKNLDEINTTIKYELEKNNLTIAHVNLLINKDFNSTKTTTKEIYFKLHEKKEFLPLQDFLLLIITVFSYLFTFTIISMFKEWSINHSEDMIYHNKIIEWLEQKMKEKNQQDGSRKIKSLLKDMKEIHTFDTSDKYKPTVQNLAKLYKTYYAVDKKLKKYNTSESKEEADNIEEIGNFLKGQLSKIEEMLKDDNSEFSDILSSLKKKMKKIKKINNFIDKLKNYDFIFTLFRIKVSDLKMFYKKSNNYNILIQYNVDNELEIPLASLKQVLTLYCKLKKELEEYKIEKHKEFLKNSIKKIKKKIDAAEENQISNIRGIRYVFSAYDIVIYEKKNKDEKIYKNLLKLIEHKKYTKKMWSTILEIIEEKAHHSLLSGFKNHDLRLRPYSIRSLTYDKTEIMNESKILNIYYKIYNILLPLKEAVVQNMTSKVDDKLMYFITYKIEELQKHKYNTIRYFLIKYMRYFIGFSIGLLFLLAGVSKCIYIGSPFWKQELFLINALFLLNFLILFIVLFCYVSFKKSVYSKFSLLKNKIGHYINNISLLFVSISMIIFLDIYSEKIFDSIIKSFQVYGDMLKKFGQLLLPSSFADLHSMYDLTPMQILVYKVVFLLLFGYFIFTIINFLINKYDALYFTKQKKTLIPPELALISINFLLSILFLGLIYGTYMHYLDALNYVDSYGEGGMVINGSFSGNDESDSNYIPFSIFIAVIGGLLTMATKDLLENYFAGISLQMDSPYEEHDRITINDSGMLEVTHIGIRADKFYEIKSNAVLVIPHKKLIDETIVNFTLPTLDYRHQLTIYVPHVDYMEKENERSLPKRAEMLLLLSIFVNTGVKIPLLEIEKSEDIEKAYLSPKIKRQLEEYRYIINSLLDDSKKQKVEEKKKEPLDKKELNKLKRKISDKFNEIQKVIDTLDMDKPTYEDVRNKYVENIWDELHSVYEQEEDDIVNNPLKKLFIFKLIKAVDEAENDQDEKNEAEETRMILKIKSTVVSILLSLKAYEEMTNKLHHHYDSNMVLRKYRMFREEYKKEYEYKEDDKDKSTLHDMARELVNINYYYFDLAASLWKLKELQHSLYRKREIDSTSLELLDVPRVTTEHIYSGEGNINYWKVTADITLELSEQSSEIIHHINMYLDNLWEEFDLPKYYQVENNKSSINFKNITLENLLFQKKEE